jgi:ZIP family zinc transporter
MGEALLWGLVAGSSLILGGLAALALPIRRRSLGLVMAFGSGVLISAVAYELVGEALNTTTGGKGVGLGLAAGTAVFLAGDEVIDRLGGEKRKHSGGGQAEGSPLAIVLGIVLDGIPESIVIGLTLIQEQAGAALIVAVFISNIPEAIAATSGLARSGWRRIHVVALWTGVTAVAGISSVAGYAAFDSASPDTVAFVLSFAGGALLTMLADTMMPEAFEHGGKLVGAFTTLGFAAGIALTALQ